MKVLFLPISGRTGASSRYRIHHYLPLLQEAGIEATVVPPSERRQRGLLRLVDGVLEMSACLKASRHADVLFIQKRLFDSRFLRKLHSLGKRIVFDFDDSIFTSPKGNWSQMTRSRVQSRLKATFSSVNLVIAGNEFLKAYAHASGVRRAEVLPTPIDVTRYLLKDHAPGSPPVLGWIGHSVNHPYVDLLSQILPAVRTQFPSMQLLMVSDKTFQMQGIPVENRQWSEETEISDLNCMDVGLMPLPDSDWTRGKCALKALQYMASGIPPVCSPVGANFEAIEHGREGFLPRNDQEWIDCLSELLISSKLRNEMGAEGRRKVEQRYSLHALAPRMIELLKSL